jgi:Mrp family chromosome partitioning ATPase
LNELRSGTRARGSRSTLGILAPSPDADRLAWVEPKSNGALDAYLRAIRAHRLLVVAVLLATLLACIAWLAQRSPQYKATAELLINPLAQSDDTFLGLPVIKDSGDPTRTMQTAAALLESPAAARATARRLGGGWTERRVLDHVNVEPEGESNILAVTAKARSGRKAADTANAFAAAALRQRDAALRREVSRVIDRLTSTRARLRRGDPSLLGLDSRIGQLEQVRLGGDPTARLSRLATSWSSAEGLPSWLIVALALVAGFALGSAAALLNERLSPRTIRAEEELDEIDPTPVLARVPNKSSRGPIQRRRTSLAILTSFRGLELQLRAQEGEHRAVLFTSPSAGDGKTSSVINFARALVSAEQEVILFDLDLRTPDLARRLGVAEHRNLHSALASSAGLSDALSAVPGMPMMSVVPGIADATGPTLEQVGQRLPELIDEARAKASYVLIDTSALGEVGDALRFIDAVDDIVFVARLNNTRVTDVEVGRDLLRRARKPATGYVLLGCGRVPRSQLPAERPRPPTEPAPEPPTRDRVRAVAPYISISDLVAAGLLTPAAELVGTVNGQLHIAHVRGERIELNGVQYASLSGAAASVTGRQTNGWTFWHARVQAGDVPLAQLRAELQERG